MKWGRIHETLLFLQQLLGCEALSVPLLSRFLVVFQPPSRNMIGFKCSRQKRTLPQEELAARVGVHFSCTPGSKEFQYCYDIENFQALVVAVEKSVLCIGLYKVLAAGVSGEEMASAAADYSEVVRNIKIVTFGQEVMDREERKKNLQPFRRFLSDDKQPDVCGKDLYLLIDRGVGVATGHQPVLYLAEKLASGAATSEDPPAIGITARRRRGGVLNTFALHRRPYRTATLLEPEIAFIMANLARVRNGFSVCDPFCGSCSLLMSAAYLGADLCVGLDADTIALDEAGIRKNFEHLALPPPVLILSEVSRAVASTMSLFPFHAIITDPPYGIGARAMSSPCSSNAVEAVICELLEFAAAALVVGGRLVFLYPSKLKKNEPVSEEVPVFLEMPKTLKIVYAVPQVFSSTFRRWLIVIEKHTSDDARV